MGQITATRYFLLFLVPDCTQTNPRTRRKYLVAVIWPIWSCSKCQGDPWSADEQVQGIWICHHDQLRWKFGRHTVAQWLHPGKQSAPGQLQN
jgi:hypothetical protein